MLILKNSILIFNVDQSIEALILKQFSYCYQSHDALLCNYLTISKTRDKEFKTKWACLGFLFLMHKQERIVLERSARLNLDPGRGD